MGTELKPLSLGANLVDSQTRLLEETGGLIHQQVNLHLSVLEIARLQVAAIGS